MDLSPYAATPRQPRRRLISVAGYLAAALLPLAAGAAPDGNDSWWTDPSSGAAWTTGGLTAAYPNVYGVVTLEQPSDVTDDDAASDWADDPALFDPDVEPAQMAVPRGGMTVRRRSTPATSRQASARAGVRGAAVVGLASIPYMIGDTGAGTCLGIQGLVQAKLSHPSLACARLNVAEANTAVPVDRLYYSYRHFHSSSIISAYQFKEILDLDRHLIAWEKTFWDGGASVELRLPIEQRINSDIFSIIAPDFGVVDPLVAPRDGRRTELGNIAGIFKYLLWESQSVLVSGGLGVTLPTARDVDYRLAVSGDGIILMPANPDITADMAIAIESVFANETVYLEPFLAWLVRPYQRWYHQGFLQFETAANPSRATVTAEGATLFSQNNVPIGFYDFSTPVPIRGEMFPQTLMRLNLGTGYFFRDDPRAPWVQQIAGIFEMHYTTTLNDANFTDVPLTTNSSVGTVPLQTITIGNGLNRVDLLNAAAGVSVTASRWTITNGAVAPIRRSPDRGFDFEYNVQVQRAF